MINTIQKSTQTHPIIYLDTIDSTNEEAKRRLKDPHTPHPKTPFAIVSNTQTQGKGQRNHQWESGSEDGLYYTLVIEPEQFDMAALQSYYNQIGELIINIIKTQSGRHANLKQPNDILIDNKKVVGILMETIIGSQSKHPNYIIIGIGMNINQDQFPESIKNIATSLRQLTNQSYNKQDFIDYLTKEIPYVFKRR